MGHKEGKILRLQIRMTPFISFAALDMNSTLATRLNTNSVLIASAFVTLIALVLGFAIAGVWLGAALATGVVSAWLLGRRNAQMRDGFADIGLIATFALAAAGMLARAPALLMEIGGVAALLCWSCMRMELRISAVKRVDHADAIARNHLRLALTAGVLGFALAGLAALVRTNFSFAGIFFIGLFAALLMSFVIGRWRTER
jgi:hypothetical protein